MSQTIAQNQRLTTTDQGWDVQLRQVSKDYNGEKVVHDVDLEVRRGEFFSILGPSGCGKTTTLRLIAGFEIPTAGEVYVRGQLMTQVPPYRRPVNTVFQSYALFSHLTVKDNIAFGLRLQKLPRAEVSDRVRDALHLVKMEAFASRFPAQLSGGQQQRVALARALVNRPAVVLLDEPLGALDLKLRKEMQVELANLHRELGLTFVMVTHDQEEALSLSNRIAVMNQGKIEQVDTPPNIYELPRTPFVAEFIGDTNLIQGKIEGFHPTMLWVVTDSGLQFKVKLPELGGAAPTSGRVMVSIRPEKIQVSLAPPADQINWVEGRLHNVMYLGTHVHYLVRLQTGESLVVRQPNAAGNLPAAHTPIYLSWGFGDCLALPA